MVTAMRDDPFDGLIGSHADRHNLSPLTGAEIPPKFRRRNLGMNNGMLIQDLGLQSLPYGSGASEGFSVGIGSDDEAVAALIQHAIPGRGYRSWRGWDCLRDYLQSALHYLVERDLFLEIEYFQRSDTPEARPVAFRIEILQPDRIRRRIGRYEYLVAARSADEGRQSWTAAPIKAAELVVTRLPRNLRRDVDRALELLRATDDSLGIMTDFTTGQHGQDSGFDFADYQRLAHDIVLRGTRRIGWTGRGILMNDLLDPAKAWRAIQFAKFGVELRDIALSALQEAVNRAGAEIGFTAQIEISGILRTPDLNLMEAALAAGTQPMSELMHPRREAPEAL